MMRSTAHLSIESMCRLGQVSQAGFYRHWKEHEPRAEQAELRARMQQIVLANRRNYGYRRVTRELRNQGFAANHKCTWGFAPDSLLGCKGFCGGLGKKIPMKWVWVGEEECAVVGLLVFEYPVDGVQYFSGDCDQRLELCFVAGEQALVEGGEVGVVSGGDECGHVKGASQVAASGAADA